MKLQNIFIVLGTLIAVGSVAYSQAPPIGGSVVNPSSPGQYTPVADDTAQSLTIPSGAIYAVVCAEVTNHRYTWDGTTTPTASVGTQLLQNNCVPITGSASMGAFKIIDQTSGGKFTVSYGK